MSQQTEPMDDLKKAAAYQAFRINLFACFTIWLAIGAFLIVTFMQSMATVLWVPVQGRIISSEAVQTTCAPSKSSRRQDDCYTAKVLYSYQVNAASYQGDRVNRFGINAVGRGYVQNVISAYQPGKVVEVYVDPRDPSQAVLQCAQIGELWGFLPIILIMGFFGFLLYIFWKALSKKERQ